MAAIELDHVSKRYADDTEAVRDLSLEIADGEFMILVGPSGCGKSTALRMIAGLEEITAGELRIGGTVVNDRAPKDRDIAMVFQSYALYPHMTVRENMAFALKLARRPKAEIAEKVDEAARILDLAPHLERKPAQLSGGQRQRVAMGRAIVRDPSAFLMDEPLSNLDAKLRVQMRAEIARIQRTLGTTTIFVTHDQTEAMTLGDRVAVMRLGVLQQVGSPMELYANPVNVFVAGFIGSPAMNFVPARIEDERLVLPMVDLPLPAALRAGHGGDLIAGVRPESFEDASLVTHASDRGAVFEAPIETTEAMGSEIYAHFPIATSEEIRSRELEELARDAGIADISSPAGAGSIVARLDAASTIGAGERARLWIDASGLHLFDAATGRSLSAAS